jgi:2,3-bisphosphoglycerate-dependent phosphoglycerate mutase
MTRTRSGALVLLRHGQSESNAADIFTGWSDVALSVRGLAQARGAAAVLRELGVRPTSVHTSLLRCRHAPHRRHPRGSDRRARPTEPR